MIDYVIAFGASRWGIVWEGRSFARPLQASGHVRAWVREGLERSLRSHGLLQLQQPAARSADLRVPPHQLVSRRGEEGRLELAACLLLTAANPEHRHTRAHTCYVCVCTCICACDIHRHVYIRADAHTCTGVFTQVVHRRYIFAHSHRFYITRFLNSHKDFVSQIQNPVCKCTQHINIDT